jgi:hypothetical protein
MKNEEIQGFLEPLNVEKVAMEASTYIIPMYRKLIERGYDVREGIRCHSISPEEDQVHR